MADESKSSLWIVGIVAVVGLVILFVGSGGIGSAGKATKTLIDEKENLVGEASKPISSKQLTKQDVLNMLNSCRLLSPSKGGVSCSSLCKNNLGRTCTLVISNPTPSGLGGGVLSYCNDVNGIIPNRTQCICC